MQAEVRKIRGRGAYCHTCRAIGIAKISKKRELSHTERLDLFEKNKEDSAMPVGTMALIVRVSKGSECVCLKHAEPMIKRLMNEIDQYTTGK